MSIPPDGGRLRTLFWRAVELPAPRRARFLDREAGDDAELRAELDRLLESHEAATDFLETPWRVDRGEPDRSDPDRGPSGSGED